LHICDLTIKKREHLIEISTLMKQKTKVKSKSSILIKVIIAVKTDWVKKTFFLNTEAQLNVISQCFTVINEMIKLNMKISQFLFLNDHSSYCYDAYLVQYYLKDDWKQKCNCEHVFYVMNKNEFELILNLFTLKKKNIHIDCELMIWCFEIDLWMFIFKDVESFEETTDRLVTYIFFWFVFKVKTVHIQNINVTFVIFSVYAEYENVFFKVEVKCLSAHEKHDYVINTNNKNSSYKSLYNLSDKKLQILWSYLNNILVKNWIQHSVNSAEASILFILKKDDDLWLCVNYCELNKITVKNCHSLLLISEILN